MSDRVERLREFVAGYHPEAEALMALLDEVEQLREERDRADVVIVYQHTELERLRMENAAMWAQLRLPREEA